MFDETLKYFERKLNKEEYNEINQILKLVEKDIYNYIQTQLNKEKNNE